MPLQVCNTRTARPQSTASGLIGQSVSCRHESLAQPHMAQWMLACSPTQGRDSFRPASVQMLGAVACSPESVACSPESVACSPESVACSQWCALTWLDLHRNRTADIHSKPTTARPQSALTLHPPPCSDAQMQVRGHLTVRLTHVRHCQILMCIDRSAHTACMQRWACFSPSKLQRCVTLHVSAVRESSGKRPKPSMGS